MRRGVILIASLAAALNGCALHSVWVKDGASPEDLQMDAGQCRARSYSMPSPMGNGYPLAMVYNACMQGKGWHQEQQTE
ncbi:conserved exported hypothetical protein [Burkholderiales bacterium]|jgi:hypothetical protein|nr:conserved exported hypothetical protein [Burkholderiales bacterium]